MTAEAERPAARQAAGGARARPPLLRLRGISKRFGEVVANEAVDLELAAGEILALLGENGAGKTTLTSILFGHYAADAGEVLVADQEGRLVALPPGRPEAALEAGIGMVHQHFTLAHNLTGFENIVLGTEAWWRPRPAPPGARRRIEELARRMGLEVELDRPVGQLGVGARQRIEILKALYREARVLVLDEPTAVLTPQEAEGLFATVRALAADGRGVIFISHKLAEVEAVAERVVVLRQGRKVADRPLAGTSRSELARLMVGREVREPIRRPRPPGEVVLALDGVGAGSGRDRIEDVTLELRAGEILGIAGVSGNGQAALAALVAGLLRPERGRVELLGSTAALSSPAAAVRAGVGRIPEDRERDGVVGELDLAENLALERLAAPETSRLGFLRRKAMRARARRAIEAFGIRAPGPDVPVRLLSGGNMQKVVLARALDGAPRLLLADQPTRGLDVAATAFVHERLLEARERGAAVLLISEDLDELLGLSDRIAVVHRGRLAGPFPSERLDVPTIGLLMAGHEGGLPAAEVAA
ncbi:MAG: ABC transporter ATP-binding protein [Geminicoccaceae bacterium]|nr:ABC transporter ATP-binding protein [Geminicoccaceae bacterium]MCX8102287.1 ABC transporter ATP-binding protein [Geminicoccaceae bacterium]MDW8369367.1 ABC transporter ATP-binding protein [Geminicoccaceae bacterium]